MTFGRGNGATQNDIYFVEDGVVNDDRVAPGSQDGVYFSPNRKWIAYSSNEYGEWEVVVEPYPNPDRVEKHVGKGWYPRWSLMDERLYFMKEGAIWEVERGEGWLTGSHSPTQLLEGPFVESHGHGFDVAPDPDNAGQDRFLVIKPTDPGKIRKEIMWVQH